MPDDASRTGPCTETLTMLTITYPSGRNPLRHQYRCQCEPQRAYLWIDTEDGSARFAPDAEIGGAVPAAVWHGLTRRIPCSSRLTGREVREYATALLPLVQRVIDGTACEWDGHNHVGIADDDAVAALGRLAEILAGGVAP